MELKIRQPKKDQKQQHPDYMMGAQQTWADKDRERTKGSFMRNFVAILIVLLIVIIILIVAAVTAIVPAMQQNQISAADTFAVSQMETQQMEESATTFAKGVLTYAYCSDQDRAFAGKNAALSTMANNTDSYASVMNLEQVNPIIEPQNLATVVTNLENKNSSQAYAGAYTIELDAVAADVSVKDGGEDGTFADPGYHMILVMSNVQDERTGEYVWVISDATIVPY